jgi:hypothetical protein
MGRTIPSFRIASTMEEKEWKSFRKALDKSDRKVFDDMFAISHLYNSASSYSAKYVRLHTIFMSIIIHHYKQLSELSKQMEEEEKSSTQDTS